MSDEKLSRTKVALLIFLGLLFWLVVLLLFWLGDGMPRAN